MKTFTFGIITFCIAFVLGHVAATTLLNINSNNETVGVNNDVPITAERSIEPDTTSEDEALLAELKLLEEVDDDIAAPDKFTMQLLKTGPNFHADQIFARNGEKWLGLFNEDGMYSLRQTTLKIKRVPDELVHGPSSPEKGKLTGKSVSVDGGVQPLFLLKNAPRLQAGTVTTLFEGEKENWKTEAIESTLLDKTFHRSFELAGKDYELKVIKARNKRGEPILALMLESDGVRQLLHTFWTRTEGDYGARNWLGSVGTLYWVGDLDGDNKPDLYLSLFEHMKIGKVFLLLSSQAEKGELVRKVAVFETSGCG